MILINGNISGIKDSIIEKLEELYEFKLTSQTFIAPEMLAMMSEYSCMLNREISVYISRSGSILDVSIGSSDNVSMPYIRKRRGTLGLSGVRCIHTHPSGSPMLSSVDKGTLISSRLDAMAAVSCSEGKAVQMCVGMIADKLSETVVYGPFFINRIPQGPLMNQISVQTAKVAELIRLTETQEQKERAMLIGLNSTNENMRELALLAKTAGADVVSTDIQHRERDNANYIGKGKAKELALKASALDADLAIFDDELTAIEMRNLEEILGLKVVDRTALILDIFAAHATSREGKLQVELAQNKYNLPRLSGFGSELSRLGGGIGTRGPGEKKIEVDKRRIRRRIFELEHEIKKLSEERQLRRTAREKNRIKEVALVGYTNAGKSSLLHVISDAEVYIEDKLFATLDPITRKVTLPSGREVLFTDTVGFIEKLPHDLISAFKSTLEEAVRADLLLCVTDASGSESQNHIRVVNDVLSSLGAADKPMITVYNKCDLLSSVPEPKKNCAYICAKDGTGVDSLLAMVDDMLKPKYKNIVVKLSYSEGARLANLQRIAKKIDISCVESGMIINALIPEDINQI